MGNGEKTQFHECHRLPIEGASQVVLLVKNLPANAGDARDMSSILSQSHPPEKEMATRSSILAWRIPWTEESGRLQFMRSQRAGQD